VRPSIRGPFDVPPNSVRQCPEQSRSLLPSRRRPVALAVLRYWAVGLALLLLPGLAWQAARAEEAAGADVLGPLLQAIGAQPHARASFVEHQYLKILKRPLESRGELLFTPPDLLEKRTLAPRPERLRVEAGQLTLERGKRHLSVSLSSYPQLAPLVEGIRATLAGDRATLERLFVVAFAPGSGQWSLVLQPRDAQLAGIVRELRIGGRGSEVLSVETLRGDGDRSVMDITPLDPH
jgi:hypothetical protein